MKMTNFLVLALLAGLCFCGCAKKAQPGADASSADTNVPTENVPTHAQGKLQTMKIYLGAETMDAELALTPEEEETGLMYRTNITDETAMLFDMGRPGVVSFWMTNCPMSLSAAYINPDGVIEEIHHLEKNDNKPVDSSNADIQYVLEVNDGWFARHNINPGTLIRTERGTLPQTFTQR